ncbi:MAG: pseudouridine synthase [Flavobacteriales bacterium]
MRKPNKKDFKPRGTKFTDRRPAKKTFAKNEGGKSLSKRISQDFPAAKSMLKKPIGNEPVRLNKYLSQCGVASRREADELIKIGLVEVNGEIITEMGFKVKPGDKVKYDGGLLSMERNRYFIMNKPKNVASTVDDTKGRRTVMNVIKGACKEHIYPVGKLDRMAVGLLLFTNDGDMAKRLIHPKNGVSQLYEVHLREKVKSPHLETLREGIVLDGSPARADEVAYVGDGSDPHKIGIRISSTRNKLVHKMFEHFGYTITKVDRVMFAGLSKKNLKRGEFRELTEQEVNFLKMIR